MQKIITSRLIIRKFKDTDGDDLFEYLSDEETLKYEPYEVLLKEEAYKEAKRRSQDYSFLAVCLKDGKLIGNIYFAKEDYGIWETGYVFNRKYWKQGYATEALNAVIKNGFESLGARRVIAMCNTKNENSWRLLERVGMRREGMLIQNIFFFTDCDGRPLWQDTYEYAILKSEYLMQRK